MHPARRKRLTDSLMLGSAQALVSFFRAVFRVKERFSSGKQQEKLQELRLKMDAIEREKQEVFQKIQHGSVREGLDAVDAMLERHGDEETRQEREEHRQKMQAGWEESDALQAIHKGAAGNFGEAVKGYRAYLVEHPESHMAYSYLGGALTKQSDWDESLKAYSEALRLSEPGSVSETITRVSIGTVLQKKGRLDDAIAEFRLAVETSDVGTEVGNCSAYLALGDALNQQGKRAEARAAWKKVIKLDNTKILAKKARKLLKENP